ncbi:hypothetical protein [Knoellia sp. Soil729]|uniref:hypothetical protein n=1 Tax=Knoellia sp. Soil729 TaxID=1736394 RepID=UPI0006FD9462|nr:hypothetical protein [Knoellia sp. Soil729]KRE41049.1 hypothetical protein ASG74_14380 [Knoellia sp. Soil729]
MPFVEDAIEELVRQYIEHPYAHRVEHSLHAEFYRILTGHPHLSRRYPLGTTGYRTGLVHKEWPETVPRPDKAGRRGNFDIVILAPTQLAAISSIDQFTRGEIAAPIVIELGLGYGETHLTGDVIKLRTSRVHHPYLVHFSHVRSRRHAATETAVMKVQPPLQVAYVRHDPGAKTIYIKHLADTTIKTT